MSLSGGYRLFVSGLDPTLVDFSNQVSGLDPTLVDFSNQKRDSIGRLEAKGKFNGTGPASLERLTTLRSCVVSAYDAPGGLDDEEFNSAVTSTHVRRDG